MVFQGIRAAFMADAPAGHVKFQLESSFSFMEGVRRLRAHKWRLYDIHYVIMFTLVLFCLIICEKPGPLVRFLIAIGLIYLCTVPALSQFWLNFMPTGAWLILFYTCRYIPPAWRPSIYVRVLPGLESILYGGNLSAVLASAPNAFSDVMAWIPYGLCHYGAPFVVAPIMFMFGPPGYLKVFMFGFGYMNIIGVLVQLLFPNAPPWYQNTYGLAKANYGMNGSAGGLARIDQLLGINLYTGGFEASPQVFGAFPSLHSGSAVIEALFMSNLFPKMAPVFTIYVMWIWWSTMYLTHHYFVDLTFGAILALSTYYLCAMTIMPRVQPGKFGRWSYDHVEYGIKNKAPRYNQKAFDEESIFDQRAELSPQGTIETEEMHEMATLPPHRLGTPQLSAQVSAQVSRANSPMRRTVPETL